MSVGRRWPHESRVAWRGTHVYLDDEDIGNDLWSRETEKREMSSDLNFQLFRCYNITEVYRKRTSFCKFRILNFELLLLSYQENQVGNLFFCSSTKCATRTKPRLQRASKCLLRRKHLSIVLNTCLTWEMPGFFFFLNSSPSSFLLFFLIPRPISLENGYIISHRRCRISKMFKNAPIRVV